MPQVVVFDTAFHHTSRSEPRAGAGGEGHVSADGARPEVWVIPTDEELLIARDTFRVVHGTETRY